MMDLNVTRISCTGEYRRSTVDHLQCFRLVRLKERSKSRLALAGLDMEIESEKRLCTKNNGTQE